METDLYSLSPSQAYSRINTLNEKKDYEGLSPEESEELEDLKEMYVESSPDFEEIDY
ncbi:DUF896 domain-containing protein [Flexithrix dorotheae]|uniref:DUF896 domain-containing protein n=1 Tax=Flexithrix dorotheae TaxID=70993 RepID=UPI00039E0AE0|nr:DUF896 domain-containing protein [Flexithrix dorotheae]